MTYENCTAFKGEEIMKTPKLEEMTLREKIGQTLIFNHSNLGKLENPKEYFRNNTIGSVWVCVQSKQNY